MKKYIKNPIVIEAIQFDGDNELLIMEFVGKKLEVSKPPKAMLFEMEVPNEAYSIIIPTLEGNMICMKNDFVIKGIKGEFYPCKPEIFRETYKVVD